ncbi:MAG: hypothetical protein Q8S73_34445 [Deltaproteobacteria bacterium]|nr:hypothetical protein [Myxococcales bacterium]MDP3219250.1 hypothetical protein [Deltaproteobacteria bacterium]
MGYRRVDCNASSRRTLQGVGSTEFPGELQTFADAITSEVTSGTNNISLQTVDIKSDPQSRLYVLNRDPQAFVVGSPPSVCWDGVTFSPYNLGTATGTSAPLTFFNAGSQCFGNPPDQTFSPVNYAYYRTCPAVFNCPNSGFCQQRGCGCDLDQMFIAPVFDPATQQTVNVLQASQPSACGCSPQVPLQCFASLGWPNANAVNLYSDWQSSPPAAWNFPAYSYNRPNYLSTDTASRWARIPYREQGDGGVERVQLRYRGPYPLSNGQPDYTLWSPSAGPPSWGNRAFRNYDIGYCNATLSWPAVATLVAETQNTVLRGALANQALPELWQPTNGSQCPFYGQISSTWARVALTPTLATGSTLDASTQSRIQFNDGINLRLRHSYFHGTINAEYPAVYREGEVFASVGMGVAPLSIGGGMQFQATQRSVSGNGWSQESERMRPMGWDMARYLSGQSLLGYSGAPAVSGKNTIQYVGSCGPNIPSFNTALRDSVNTALDGSLLFFWRLPNERNSYGQCVATSVPTVRCSTPVTATAVRSGTAPASSECAAALDAILASGSLSPYASHPLFASLRQAGVTGAVMMSPPGSGCYSVDSLPLSFRSEVRSTVSGVGAGVCVTRLVPTRLNVMPDQLQFVLADTTSTADRFLAIDRIATAVDAWVAQAQGRLTPPLVRLDCDPTPYVAPFAEPFPMLGHDAQGNPEIGELNGIPTIAGDETYCLNATSCARTTSAGNLYSECSFPN